MCTHGHRTWHAVQTSNLCCSQIFTSPPHMCSKDAVHVRRFHYMLSPTLPLGEGIFTSTHEDRTWRATRKFIAPFFSLPNLRCVLPFAHRFL